MRHLRPGLYAVHVISRGPCLLAVLEHDTGTVVEVSHGSTVTVLSSEDDGLTTFLHGDGVLLSVWTQNAVHFLRRVVCTHGGPLVCSR